MEIVEVRHTTLESGLGLSPVASAILSKNCALLALITAVHSFYLCLNFIPWYLQSFALPNALIREIDFLFRVNLFKHGASVSPDSLKGSHSVLWEMFPWPPSRAHPGLLPFM